MIKRLGNTDWHKNKDGLELFIPPGFHYKKDGLYGLEIDINRYQDDVYLLKMYLNIYFITDHLLCTMYNNKVIRVIKKIPAHTHLDNNIKLTIKDDENKVVFLARIAPGENNNALLLLKDFKIIQEKYLASPDRPLLNHSHSVNINDYLDRIYYINMAERPERRKHIINQLMKLQIPKSMVSYVKAVSLPHNPQIGCALSHMKALSDATKNEYDTVLILEDDFTFKVNKENLLEKLEMLYHQFPNFDVCMLSTVNSKSNLTGNHSIRKVVKADTTAGYIVKKSALALLFNIFYQCTKPKIEYCANQAAIDVAWQVLQPKLNWYIFEPNLGYQSEKFTSDIEIYRNIQYKI